MLLVTRGKLYVSTTSLTIVQALLNQLLYGETKMILSLLIATAVASLVVIVKLTLQLRQLKLNVEVGELSMEAMPKAYEQVIKQSFPETHQQMYEGGRLKPEYGAKIGIYLIKSVLNSV
jgi:hypothetical protein